MLSNVSKLLCDQLLMILSSHRSEASNWHKNFSWLFDFRIRWAWHGNVCHWPYRQLLSYFRRQMAQWCHRTKICTKQSLVVGASASQWWHLDFLSPKCDNFAYWLYWPSVQTIENVLKNWVDRMEYSRASHVSDLNNVFHS